MLRFCLLSFLFCLANANYQPNWKSIDSRPIPEWFDNSKIGIFIHWGLYSVPGFGSEWLWMNWARNKSPEYDEFMRKNFRPNFTYQDFGPKFTAEFYDPDQWAEIFNASGARYIVLTSKHHEGYTMWPSKYSWNWNVKDVGPNRDLLGDLAKAVRKYKQLHFGVYYSLMDWFHPLYLKDKGNKWSTRDFVETKTMPELYELVFKYKPEIIWSDGDWEAPDIYWKSTGFLAWLYNESPIKDVIAVNDRWGRGISCHHGGYLTCTDRYSPGKLQARKWEDAMTLDYSSWGYRRNAQIADIMPIEKLIATLAETISCGGNILINIGPTHDGRIIPIFEERLRQLGSWLQVNGEAIYESKPWKYQNDTYTPNIWYTSKNEAVYAIVLNWPKNNLLILRSVKLQESASVYMLGWKTPLQWKSISSKGTQIAFPSLTPDLLPSNWAWVLKINQ